MHLLSDRQDSALTAFHKGLELAESIEDHKLQSILAQNLSVAYRETGQYRKAVTYLPQSFKLSKDSSDLSRYYLNLVKIILKNRSIGFYLFIH